MASLGELWCHYLCFRIVLAMVCLLSEWISEYYIDQWLLKQAIWLVIKPIKKASLPKTQPRQQPPFLAPIPLTAPPPKKSQINNL